MEGNDEGQNDENTAIGDEREEADQENDGMFGVSILNLFIWKYFANFFRLTDEIDIVVFNLAKDVTWFIECGLFFKIHVYSLIGVLEILEVLNFV